MLGALTVLAFGQLLPQLVAATHPATFMNLPAASLVVNIALGLEWVGITHFSWLISSVAKRCSGLQGSQTTGLEPPSDAKVVGAEAELPTDINELQTMVRQMQAEIAREREAHALSWQALEAKVSTQPSLCVLSDAGRRGPAAAGLTRHCGPASIFLWSLHLLRSRAAPIRRRRRTRPRRVRTSRRGRRDRDSRRSLGGRAVWLVPGRLVLASAQCIADAVCKTQRHARGFHSSGSSSSGANTARQHQHPRSVNSAVIAVILLRRLLRRRLGGGLGRRGGGLRQGGQKGREDCRRYHESVTRARAIRLSSGAK